MIPKPFSYSRQDWEDNPKWIYDAYRRVAFDEEWNSDDPKKRERFIKYLATLEELTDPKKIGIGVNDGEKLIVTSGPYAEKVISPFMPLIEAITDELLELVKIFGKKYVDLKTIKASSELREEIKDQLSKHNINIPGYVVDNSVGGEDWALHQLKNELRNAVAANMFQSIRDYALIEHLHREHHISDDKYDGMIDHVTARLDGCGMNGLERFLQMHPELEESLKSDKRKFVPEQYKIKYSENDIETGELSEWWPNDREQRRIERREFYQWHLNDLDKKFPINSALHADKKYADALLTAQHQAIGPDYCKAVEKRNKVMWGYELGKGGLSTVQREFNYAVRLGHDLSNEELKKLMENGTKDLTPEKAKAIYQINNLLGTLDPRLEEAIAKSRAGKVQDFSLPPFGNKEEPEKKRPLPDPSRPLLGYKKELEKDLSKQLTEGDESREQKKSPLPGEQDAASGSSSASSHTQPENASPKKKDDQKKNDSDKFVTAGQLASTAVFGALIYDGLKNYSSSDKNNTDEQRDGKDENKSDSKFLRAVEVVAAAAGIILVWKYPNVIFGWLNRGGRSA